MPDVSWVVFQLVLLSLRRQKRHCFSLLFVFEACVLLLPAVLGDRTAFIEFGEANKNHGSPEESQVSAQQQASLKLLQLQGSFSNAGSVKQANGLLYGLPEAECGEEDDAGLVARPRNWVALFHYPYRDGSNQTASSGTSCQSVLDRVKKAMLFGASAVIILALNPKIVKELDITQLFARPVVLIEEVANVSAVLDAILTKLKLHVKITFNTTFYDLQKVSTVTLWATCGISSGVNTVTPWEGVVCMDRSEAFSKDQEEYTVIYSRCWRPTPNSGLVCSFDGEEFGKTDPGQFWHYFSALAAMLMLLLVIKAKVEDNDNPDMDQMEQALRRIAGQALSVMKTKRYKVKKSRINFDDSERDTCAVCLEYFYPKQKIRVLPCQHEFHSKCVDPWLIKQRTCPLCKLNITDA